MSTGNGPHLDGGRIMASIVDERELSAREREHLDACPECARARAVLAAQLEGMARRSALHTPPLRKGVVLPEEQPARLSAWVPPWSVGLAAAVAMVVVVAAFLLVRLFPGGLPSFEGMSLASETARDELLLAEVRALENDPLPAAYAELVPVPGVVLDEDFFDFLIPLGTNGETGETMEKT